MIDPAANSAENIGDTSGAPPKSEPVAWTAMENGSRQDYHRLGEIYESHARGTLVDNLLAVLGLLKGPTLGYQVDRYEHSLQSASRAMRAGESVDLVVGALLHDIGDVLAPHNHSETAAAILSPFVDDRTHWIVEHHGLFQGYYYFHHHDGDRDARDQYQSSVFFEDCVQFCADYDQNCFDPDYRSLAIEEFRPSLDEVFNRPSQIHGVPTVVQAPDQL